MTAIPAPECESINVYPIETCPSPSGTIILIEWRVPKTADPWLRHVVLGERRSPKQIKEGWLEFGGWYWRVKPTHWAPLPDFRIDGKALNLRGRG